MCDILTLFSTILITSFFSPNKGCFADVNPPKIDSQYYLNKIPLSHLSFSKITEKKTNDKK